MGKNIVILNGSPRPNGNTMGLIEAFTKGAREAGHTVTRLDLTKLGMHPCLGCNKGGEDPKSPCVQKDGMDSVYMPYVESTVVVMASPLYSWSISAQLKCVLDRFYALGEGPNPMGAGPKKDALMLMAGASPIESSGPQSALEYFKVICKGLGWNHIGAIYAGRTSDIGDIAGKPELEEAYKLGLSIQ